MFKQDYIKILHLKAFPPTHSKVCIILQTTLISAYNFKGLLGNSNTNILKLHKLNYLGPKRHHGYYKTSQKYFL